MTAELTPEETRRYGPQLLVRAFGGEGQQALRRARLLVVGAGGLGSAAIAYLAAAGIGRLGIADHDDVSLSNLSRQIVHGTGAVGAPKVASAAGFARALNTNVEVLEHRVRVGADDATTLLARYDIVVDATDNFATRRTLAAAARALGLPLVTGAASGFEGQVTVFGSRPDDPGFVHLFPDEFSEGELEACQIAGIIGPVAGIIGTLMAVEAIKLITGAGTPLIGRLLLYDGRSARFTDIDYGPAPTPPGA